MPKFPDLSQLDMDEIRQQVENNMSNKNNNPLNAYEPVDNIPSETDDYMLWPGGPYHSQLLSWKKQYETNKGGVYIDVFDDEKFIWRTMSRYEYKVITSAIGTDPLVREEMICATCVLWPPNYSYEVMAPERAGIPAVLAQHIMKASGFVDVQPTRL